MMKDIQDISKTKEAGQYDETLGEAVKEVTGLVRNETVAALKRMQASLLSIANPYCDAEVSGNALNELSDIVLDLATRSCLIGVKVGRDIENQAWSQALEHFTKMLAGR